MESEIYQFQRVVVEDDIDQMNHVNNLQYLRWCLKAAVAHSAHVGWPTERYVEAGAGFIVREHKIKYKVPAVLGDEVVIQTWIDSLKKYSTVRKYKSCGWPTIASWWRPKPTGFMSTSKLWS